MDYGRHNDSMIELLSATKWMSVFQLAMYHSLLLYWKVRFHGKPERLIRRINYSQNSLARLQLTERVWSRVSERNYRMVEMSLQHIAKISVAKKTISEWVKANVPITEE